MPDRYRCRVERATVRPEKRDALKGLVRKLFTRRHHNRVGGRETEWLTVELVQSLREESQVYRDELSTKTSGPLPFALGYFRVRDGQLERVSTEIPANVEPRAFVLFLSEFLQPGARFWFADEEQEQLWAVRGVGEVESPSGPSEDAGDQGAEDASVEASN